MIENNAETQQFTFRIPKVLIYLFWAAAGLGIFVGILFLWVAATTGPPARAADEFFAAVLSGDTTEAYGYASSFFREEQSLERFNDELAALEPIGIELESWEDRVLQRNGFSLLNGTLETESGKTVPIVVQMLAEEGEWKVLATTDQARAGVGPGLWFKQAPVESEVRRIVEVSLQAFNAAVQTGDFEQFSDTLPSAWRLQAKLSPIGDSFARLVERQVDFSDIAGLEPVFSEPPVIVDTTACGAFGAGCRSTGSDLLVIGSYPRDAGELGFRLIFRYRHPNWVLACGTDRQCIVEVGS